MSFWICLQHVELVTTQQQPSFITERRRMHLKNERPSVLYYAIIVSDIVIDMLH